MTGPVTGHALQGRGMLPPLLLLPSFLLYSVRLEINLLAGLGGEGAREGSAAEVAQHRQGMNGSPSSAPQGICLLLQDPVDEEPYYEQHHHRYQHTGTMWQRWRVGVSRDEGGCLLSPACLTCSPATFSEG